MANMSSGTYAIRQPAPEKELDPVTVLVTGFGWACSVSFDCPVTCAICLLLSLPFLGKYPKNSSWEVASRLPALLPSGHDNPTPIHIHVHHAAIRVGYRPVLDIIPKLLPPGSPMFPKPEIILHIGLAAGRKYFTLEKGAHGRGFGAIPDVDGERFPDEQAEKKFPKGSYPPKLHTSFDTTDVLHRWRSNLGYQTISDDLEATDGDNGAVVPDVRLSPDAGNYLCGFIYWNSLAHYFTIKEDERPVVFMHVPDLSDSDEKLEQGRGVAIALIKALVESRRKRGVVDGIERVVRGEASQHVRDRFAKARTDANFA